MILEETLTAIASRNSSRSTVPLPSSSRPVTRMYYNVRTYYQEYLILPTGQEGLCRRRSSADDDDDGVSIFLLFPYLAVFAGDL